ncbi:MAG: hypothetical protein JWM91_5161 [Rhodospirillales bacterium]|nr:hypothetical protein [Rhodospirillales bacterium]
MDHGFKAGPLPEDQEAQNVTIVFFAKQWGGVKLTL